MIRYIFLSLMCVGGVAMMMRQNASPTCTAKAKCTQAAKSCCMKTPPASPAPAPAEGVSFFKGSWNELLAKAAKDKKPFWVDVYTSWCGPCKQMAKFTFTHDEVGKVSNKAFLAYKIDAEQGEGVKVASDYNVDSYPTILFFSADGKLMGREVGLQDAERFAFVMDKYIKKAGKKKKK